MSGVFVDTAYWLALLVNEDAYHDYAQTWSRQAFSPCVTTQPVLFEVADALVAPTVRELAGSFLGDVMHDSAIIVVPSDDVLLNEAAELFRARADKDWGLTDCFSFVVMNRYRLSVALTCDRHFVQAGFRALLLEEPGPS